MSNGYADDLTLDRIDTDKGYSPDNCRWATMQEQQNNRRNNRIVSYNGAEYTLSELARKLGISSATLSHRINSGWTEEEYALPANLNNKNIRRNLHE
jgi:AraC-like DNA-binding protein